MKLLPRLWVRPGESASHHADAFEGTFKNGDREWKKRLQRGQSENVSN